MLEKNPRTLATLSDTPAKILSPTAFVKGGLRTAIEDSNAYLLRTSPQFSACLGTVLWVAADAAAGTGEIALAHPARLAGCPDLDPALAAVANDRRAQLAAVGILGAGGECGTACALVANQRQAAVAAA